MSRELRSYLVTSFVRRQKSVWVVMHPGYLWAELKRLTALH